MPRRGDKRYAEHDSPFFQLRSRAKLAKLLHVSRPKLESLARAEGLYHQFEKPKASGGVRIINAPRADLKAVQARIADLLHRIAPPDYLFAPVAGRSYVDNAAAHLGAKGVRLLDIEDFFPSCNANKAIWYFRRRMQTSPGRCRGPSGHRRSRWCASAGQPLQSDPRVSLLRGHVGRDFAHRRGGGLHVECLCRRLDHIRADCAGTRHLGGQASSIPARPPLQNRQGAEQVRPVRRGNYGASFSDPMASMCRTDPRRCSTKFDRS